MLENDKISLPNVAADLTINKDPVKPEQQGNDIQKQNQVKWDEGLSSYIDEAQLYTNLEIEIKNIVNTFEKLKQKNPNNVNLDQAINIIKPLSTLLEEGPYVKEDKKRDSDQGALL